MIYNSLIMIINKSIKMGIKIGHVTRENKVRWPLSSWKDNEHTFIRKIRIIMSYPYTFIREAKINDSTKYIGM